MTLTHIVVLEIDLTHTCQRAHVTNVITENKKGNVLSKATGICKHYDQNDTTPIRNNYSQHIYYTMWKIYLWQSSICLRSISIICQTILSKDPVVYLSYSSFKDGETKSIWSTKIILYQDMSQLSPLKFLWVQDCYHFPQQQELLHSISRWQ